MAYHYMYKRGVLLERDIELNPFQVWHPRASFLHDCGPCGTSIPYVLCMDGGTCMKHYPKVFYDDNSIEEMVLLDTDLWVMVEV